MRVTRLSAIGAVLAVAAPLLAACGVSQAAGPRIQLLSAQVTEPNSAGVTEAFVVVQNSGGPIQLIGAKSSAGGTVELRAPVSQGGLIMHTVTSIMVPARSLFRLNPNGSHLLIMRSGPMTAGTEITLTLVFAHLGEFTVPAMVTNPATGGASYFLN
jgi:copper(I)-binding protein